MNDLKKPEDDEPGKKIQAHFASTPQSLPLYSFNATAKLSWIANNSALAEHVFPDTSLGKFFRNQNAFKAIREASSYSAFSQLVKHIEFDKTSALINESPFFKIMQRHKTAMDLYLSPAMINIYAPSALAIAEEQLKKNARLLSNLSKEAGPVPSMIIRHLFSHNLLRYKDNNPAYEAFKNLKKINLNLNLRDQAHFDEFISKYFKDDGADFHYIASNVVEPLEGSQESKVSEFRAQVKSARSFKDLPSWVQVLFISIIVHMILEPLNEIKNEFLMNYVKQQCFTDLLCEPRKEQQKNLTENKSSELSYRDLKRIRVVRRDNVKLRTGPSMQSEVIEMLPVNQPLLIVGRENKAWLLVITELNGEELEGWINRSYTKILVK